MKENATRKVAPGSSQKNSATGTEKIFRALLFSLSAVVRGVEQLVNIFFKFDKFGRSALKKYSINADSFFQLAIQLAYFRLHGKTVATHESCSTRQFKFGRTETIRSASIQSDAFVRAADDPSVSEEKKGVLMRKAADVHLKTVAQAINGQAFDRHLFGLRQMAAECGMDTPEIFTDKTYQDSKEIGLYTSQVPGLQDVHLGSSPFKSVKGGYGVAYRIGEEHFLITVNAFKDRERADPHRHFASSLEKSLVTLGELLPFVPKPQK